jgi:hypothetical protein
MMILNGYLQMASCGPVCVRSSMPSQAGNDGVGRSKSAKLKLEKER